MQRTIEHVLVVGGTKGLGRIVTERFLHRDFTVTVLSRKNTLNTNAQQVGLNHLEVDLEKLNETNTLVERVLTHGPLRYIIFCQRYRGESNHAWLGEIQVSLTATDLIINAFADHFCQQGDKAIAVVSSVYANFVGGSQPASYHVAKAGLNQLVKYYAWTMGKKDIRINAIMPLTYLKTENRDHHMKNSNLMELYRQFVPLKRMGDAEDSANLIDFLCSTKAAFINGQSIFVDGGTSVIWPEELAKSLSGI